MPLSISNSKPAHLFYTKVPVGICTLLVVGTKLPAIICRSIIPTLSLVSLVNMPMPSMRAPRSPANQSSLESFEYLAHSARVEC